MHLILPNISPLYLIVEFKLYVIRNSFVKKRLNAIGAIQLQGIF